MGMSSRSTSLRPAFLTLAAVSAAALLAACAGAPPIAGSPSPLKRHHDDVGREKLKKKMSLDMKPVSGFGAGSFADGHGVATYLTRKDQLPNKVALVTFYVFDHSQSKTIHQVSRTTTWVTPEGGNLFANKFLQASIGPLKAAFQQQGMELLTLEEALDTDEKKQYYRSGVPLEVSKMGKILVALESGDIKVSTSANGYRLFDVAATSDYMRSRALGGDLAGKLGVDAVLSIGLEVGTDGNLYTLNGVKWGLTGKNPNPKQDKSYTAEAFGNGYNAGQCYIKSGLFLEPTPFLNAKKQEENFEGLDLILTAFVEKTVETAHAAIEKNAK